MSDPTAAAVHNRKQALLRARSLSSTHRFKCSPAERQVVLIDIDCCQDTIMLHNLFKSNVDSCMYRLEHAPLTVSFTSGTETDYFQLGWLIMWVLEDHLDYHSQTWESHKDETKEDKFIQSIIMNGKYDPQLLPSSSIVRDKKSLETVLQERTSA